MQTPVATSTQVPQPPDSRSDRVPALAWVIAAIFVAVELAVSGRYGFQQDELYFLVAAHHLAFGYVDQPPLAPLLTRTTDLLGVSPTAIRIIPALAGGAIVVMAARLAALFGAGRLGRVLAALVTACAPVFLGAVHVGNTTPLDLLAWTTVLLCVSTALLRHQPRWWLVAGAAAGVGLEADNLVVLLLIALAVGLLFSAQRPVLRTPWPWLGAGIAAVIWAPNVVWQATHGWPQLAMSAALHRENTSPGRLRRRAAGRDRLPGPGDGTAGRRRLCRPVAYRGAAVHGDCRHARPRVRGGLGAGQGVLRRRSRPGRCWPPAPPRQNAGSPAVASRGHGSGSLSSRPSWAWP